MMSLVEKQERFALLASALIQTAKSMGYMVTLGEAHRSDETAALMAKEGKGSSHSLHRLRLAIDLMLYTSDGKYLTDTKDYEPLGKFWEAQSHGEIECCWGGRFPKPDGDHFSIAHNGVK